MFRTTMLALVISLAGCDALGSRDATAPGSTSETTQSGNSTAAFDGIRNSETVHFTGTEPFWGGEATQVELTYSTPENIDGETIAVDRFAGNNGVSFSGKLEGQSFDLMITPSQCSDGMSDRVYPYVASLKIGEERRDGCAWTDRQPRSAPTGGG